MAPGALEALPSEVMLLIISHLDIDTFLQTRLICRYFRDLTASRATFLAREVAQVTFLCPGSLVSEAHADDLSSLKNLRSKQIAAILQEVRSHYPSSIPENLLDSRTIATGLQVAARFSQVAEQVNKAPTLDGIYVEGLETGKARAPGLYNLYRREEVISCCSIILASTLSSSELDAYLDLSYALAEIFCFAKKTYSDNCPPCHLYLSKFGRCDATWLCWFMYSNGPEFLWRQWRPSNLQAPKSTGVIDGKHDLDSAIMDYYTRSPEQLSLARSVIDDRWSAFRCLATGEAASILPSFGLVRRTLSMVQNRQAHGAVRGELPLPDNLKHEPYEAILTNLIGRSRTIVH
ncbi:MAG: hypothetical protein M1820_004626 [Bogoriella megaspora]|nr:MAG: hypothetical protein M1820_004626 [Bogoriella megaspora]